MNSLQTHLYSEELYQIPAGILIVIKKNWQDYTTEEKVLLTKILQSVKVNVAQVQIISMDRVSIHTLSGLSPSFVLIFGSEIPDIKPYEVIPAQDFSMIRADDLGQLDDAKKKNLWAAMKQMFNI